jgi:hypothetical protein
MIPFGMRTCTATLEKLWLTAILGAHCARKSAFEYLIPHHRELENLVERHLRNVPRTEPLLFSLENYVKILLVSYWDETIEHPARHGKMVAF